MPTSVRLDQSAFVTLDGSGNGTAQMGPLTAREEWHPGNVHVSANQNPTLEAECRIFMGDVPIAMNYRDGTFSGSSGDSTDSLSSDVVKCGQKIIAVWTGGDAGVVATVTVTGTKEV
jgi:hypothetical protein